MSLKKKRKKWLLAVIALVLTAALGVGIWFGTKGSAEPVNVYSFQYIGMTEFWGDMQESYGPVTTDKIQTEFLSDTQTVTEVKVKDGDTVKKGDVLFTFDTTLDTLSLERKRLEVEKIKVQIKAAEERLQETRDMVPYVPPEPEELLPELPELDLPELPELPEELPELPVERLTLSPVNFAMVSLPTEPSLDRLLFFWKFFTAFSVTSPKYPVTLPEDRYPYLFSSFCTC